jgi:hypothetical protein
MTPTQKNGPRSGAPTYATPESWGQVPRSAMPSFGDGGGGATSALGSTMESLASSIRGHVPGSGFFGDAGHAVADTLENTGRYLKDHGLQGIGEEATRLVRKNPVPAMLVGLGIGFLLARIIRS